MSATFDAELRRVTVHAGAAVLDLSLPAAVPVATLIPSINDILDSRAIAGEVVTTRLQLSRPGLPALLASTTLADNAIPDGAVLVLSRSSPEPPALRHHDTAEAVAAQLGTAADPPGDRHTARLVGALAACFLTVVGLLALVRNVDTVNTSPAAEVSALAALAFATIALRTRLDPTAGFALNLIAAAFAGDAGFLAVPGPPGAANLLLAAMSVAAMSVLALRLTGCGVVTLTAVACFAAVTAVAALAGMTTALPTRAIGSASALLSIGLLEFSPRLSIVLAGLSPTGLREDHVATRAIRADKLLISMSAGFASSAAVGAMVTGGLAIPAVTGALLLLRARSSDRTRMLVFSSSGIALIATVFALATAAAPQPAIVAMTAALAGAAIYLGSAAPLTSLSPVGRRAVELVECVALVAMVPLTCWMCGLFTAVRGLNPL